MNSRLDTLINTFKLENRTYENKITEANLNHDYTNAYKILEEERKNLTETLIAYGISNLDNPFKNLTVHEVAKDLHIGRMTLQRHFIL